MPGLGRDAHTLPRRARRWPQCPPHTISPAGPNGGHGTGRAQCPESQGMLGLHPRARPPDQGGPSEPRKSGPGWGRGRHTHRLPDSRPQASIPTSSLQNHEHWKPPDSIHFTEGKTEAREGRDQPSHHPVQPGPAPSSLAGKRTFRRYKEEARGCLPSPVPGATERAGPYSFSQLTNFQETTHHGGTGLT